MVKLMFVKTSSVVFCFDYFYLFFQILVDWNLMGFYVCVTVLFIVLHLYNLSQKYKFFCFVFLSNEFFAIY